MRALHCTWAFLLLAALPAAQAQVLTPQVAASAPGAATRGYSVFFRGQPIGREDVTVQSGAAGMTVTSEGRVSAPADLVIRNAQFVYGPDGAPRSFQLDATANGGEVRFRTTVADGMAVTQGTQMGTPIAITQPISGQALLHANGIFASYVGLARRLAGAAAGTELRVYVIPQAEIALRVASVHDERMQLGTDFLDVRRYELQFVNPGGDLGASLTTTADGELMRVSVPAQSLDIVREDVAAATARTRIHTNPGDEPVVIPAAGFNLGATITRPANAAGRLPAVILLSGSGVGDRDGFALGIPTLGQLAGALADAGFLVVRYDKRGYGQSGGRSESATIPLYAEDARAVRRWLEERDDVDEDRIALVGHSEGAWVALLAAARDRNFAAVVAIAGAATTGAELVLEQQQRALDQLNLPAEERERRVALQRQIHEAVLSGRGWDDIPPDLRRQADTLWFESLLEFEPEDVIEDVRQPMLFVHGALDRQVPASHAERLAALARAESRSRSIELVVVPGVNHLLVPAKTGEVSEYASLSDRNVSPAVTMPIVDWLRKTFAAIR